MGIRASTCNLYRLRFKQNQEFGPLKTVKGLLLRSRWRFKTISKHITRCFLCERWVRLVWQKKTKIVEPSPRVCPSEMNNLWTHNAQSKINQCHWPHWLCLTNLLQTIFYSLKELKPLRISRFKSNKDPIPPKTWTKENVSLRRELRHR
jgi:hypothetical protein